MHESGLKLVTASSAEPEVLQKLLQTIGAEQLIDDIAPTTAVEKSKPDPDVVLLALEKSALSAAEVIMLGDIPYDVGVAAIALCCGGWSEADLSGAGAIATFQDPADLLAHYQASLLSLDASRATG